MTETKFTPGPWVVRSDPAHFDTLSDIWGAGELIAQSTGPWPVIQSNARLIAAAPEMFEALRECQAVLAMFTAPDAIKQSTVSHAYAAAVAAEAKARSALQTAGAA